MSIIQASNVLSGKTFSNIVDSGIEVTMWKLTTTYLPKTDDVGIDQAYHVNSYIPGDGDLVPEFIRRGITIFDVVGTFDCARYMLGDWHNPLLDHCYDACLETYGGIFSGQYKTGCEWGCHISSEDLDNKIDTTCTE
jgi:hypothetical protein